MFKWILMFLLITPLTREIQGYCYTAWGTRGICVNIKSCNPLIRLLQPRPILPPVLRILRKSQCGFEGLDPKVCCLTNAHSSDLERYPLRSISDVSNNAHKNKNHNNDYVEPTTETTTTTTAAPKPLLPIHNHPNRRLLRDEECGPVYENRIYGGNVTSIYEFPWMAMLGYNEGGKTDEFRCGGALISERYVVTAAHCTTELPEGLTLRTIRLGEYDLSSEVDCESWENGRGYNCAAKHQDFGVDRVEVHPEFMRRKLLNDISLVRLSRAADLRPPSVRPICLPMGDTVFLSNKVTVTGWGSTEFATRSQRLLKAVLPLVDTEACSEAYSFRGVKIWEKQICAGGLNGQDSCSGDSGGPLQAPAVYNGQPRYVLYGVVSFGPHGCGVEGYPGVYTSVAHYVRWILDTITE
ncbi:melanization protease 1-like [Venturia canescens]|uniref:melanization protease 1-like n=1 Tax=Venturia canescens TaxID=32260 RepID=UPI001C9CC22D|nr:melanization protease 1-like [Venturia canescens]